MSENHLNIDSDHVVHRVKQNAEEYTLGIVIEPGEYDCEISFYNKVLPFL
jgi:hypothetical protein